jgi:BlaR1 peptidase M56
MMHESFARLVSLLGIDRGAAVELVERLGWTLVHSLWQCTLIGCLLAIVLKVLGRRSAQIRYVACAAALAAMTVVAPLTFAFFVPGVAEPARADRGDGAFSNRLGADQSWARPLEELSPDRIVVGANAETQFRGERSSEVAAGPATGESGDGAWWGRLCPDVVRARVAPWLDTLVACWGCGVLLFSLRPSIGWLALRRLRTRGVAEVPAEFRDLARDVANKLGLKRAVRVVHSKLVEVPAVIGWLAPVVLLPVALTTAVTPQQLQAILAHELAHVRRHDFLVNLLQMLAETLLFYHPAVWWVSHRMRLLREDCCDDLAVHVLCDRASYARALLRVDELRVALPAPAVSLDGGVLFARIRRVMGVTNDSTRGPGWVLPPVALLALLAAGAWFAAASGRGSRAVADDGESATVLLLLDERDQPVAGHVALGRIGYGPGIAELPGWSSEKDGKTRLTNLKGGTSTLVAQPQFPNATIFTVKLPAAERTITQRLRPIPPWSGRRDFKVPEMRLSVDETEPPQAWIVMELTNAADAPFTISETDLTLSQPELRIFLPSGALVGGNVIPAHSTRILRLSWTEIVRRGIWTSRMQEDINEPWPPPSEDKSRIYVRVNFGSSGSLPLLLPAPDQVLANQTLPPAVNREPRRSLAGRIVYNGDPPAPARITLPRPDLEAWKRDGNRGNSPHRPSWAQLFFHENYHDTEIFDESLVVGPDRGLANVFVWLRPAEGDERSTGPVSDRPTEPAVLAISKGRFSPHAFVLPTWQKLEVRNQDSAGLDLSSQPLASDAVQRMLGAGQSAQLSFKPEKLPVKIRSNLGGWMSAYVLPLDHPFFAVTGNDGVFRIDDVPPGKWELVFWHEVSGWLKSDAFPTGKRFVEIPAGKLDLGEIRVAAETLAHATKIPAQPAPAAPAAGERIREFPLGNFGGIPQRDQVAAAFPASPPAALREGGWIDAEYGLQYRLLTPDHGTDAEGARTLALGELPLVSLEVRNVASGVQLDLGIESHQSRQRLIVDGVEYARHDQPWGGVDGLNVGREPVRLPFVLTRDWQTDSGGERRGLTLAEGLHRVSIRLGLFEFEDQKWPNGTLRKGINPRNSRSLVTRPLIFKVDGTRRLGERDLVMANLRREFEAFPLFHAPQVSSNLRRLVLEGRPDSVDFLISRIGDGTGMVQDPASFILASLWDQLDRPQIERYLKANMTHFVQQRAAYPAGVDAGIAVGVRFRSDYGGLPRNQKVTSETVTTHFLDGNQVGEPFRYPLHTTISHWYRTRELGVGRHTFRLATDYTFKSGGETYTGRLESGEYSFEIIAADSPNALAVPASSRLDQQVRDSLVIADVEEPPEVPGLPEKSPEQIAQRAANLWRPQIGYGGARGTSLHMPVWRLREPLPFDLCFRVDFQIEGTETIIPGIELVVFAGDARGFYFSPANFDDALKFRQHADKEGFVPIRVILTPSQALALTHPRVKNYYPAPIKSDVVRVRVDYDPKKQ